MNTEKIKQLAEMIGVEKWESDLRDVEFSHAYTKGLPILTIDPEGIFPEDIGTAIAEYISLLNPQAILALIAENERLKDSVSGLNEDLYQAVLVAYNRGATEWAELNYRGWYPALHRGQSVCPKDK